MRSASFRSFHKLLQHSSIRHKRQFVFALIVALLLAVYLVCSLVLRAQNEEPVVVEAEREHTNAAQDVAIQESAEDVTQTYCVYVCGAVSRVGIYYLDEGARVAEAIDAAGGALENASLDVLNLAALVCDEQKIYVPFEGEQLETEQVLQSYTASGASSGKVNINTASKEELMSLDGIGPSLAIKIIDYRTAHGLFQTINEIRNVSGIGDKKFEAKASYIVVS